MLLFPGKRLISSSKIGNVSKIHRPWLHSMGTVGLPWGWREISQGSFSRAKCLVRRTLKSRFISHIAISTLAQYEQAFMTSPVFRSVITPIPSTMVS